MSKQKGFSLIELMIVVAIIGIIAAIAIPALLRARIAANEASMKSDSKALASSEVTYANGNNGAYGTNLGCLAQPVTCPPGPSGAWPPGTQGFIDPQLGAVAGLPGTVNPGFIARKSGYTRTFEGGNPSNGTFDVGVTTWTYTGQPVTPNQTGTMYYTEDNTGLICQDIAAFPGGGQNNPTPCTPIGG